MAAIHGLAPRPGDGLAQNRALASRSSRAGEIGVSSILAPLALTASTGALLAIPLAPALRELRSKRDARPLVTRKDDGRIANFAASLRSRCSKLQVLLFPDGYPAENSLLMAGESRVFVVVHQFPVE